MSGRLGIGIIGCGKQASKHIAGLRRDPEVTITVADLDPARAETLAAAEQVEVAPIEALIEDRDIAALVICTPTQAHAPLAEQAVAAGKHYLCEKPLTDTRGEAEALVGRTREAGLVGQVGYTFRFAPGIARAHALVAEARRTPEASPLGRPVSAIFRMGGRGNHAAWKHRRETKGGAINEMLCHILDMALWCFPEPLELETASSRMLVPTRRIGGVEVACDTEDYVLVRGRTESGVELVLQADFVSPAFVQYLEIHGEDGSLMTSVTPEIPSFVFTNRAGTAWAKGRTDLALEPADYYTAQAAAFLDAVRGRAGTQAARVAESLRLLEATDLIRAGGGRLAA